MIGERDSGARGCCWAGLLDGPKLEKRDARWESWATRGSQPSWAMVGAGVRLELGSSGQNQERERRKNKTLFLFS